MVSALKPESHIVVVDSRPRDYQELASLAGEHHWHIHFLTTARASISFLRRAQADLWMINATLPDMSGFALHEILRDQVARASAFIISDQYDPQHEQLACQCGAEFYLCKGPAYSLDHGSLLQLLLSRASLSNSQGMLSDPLHYHI